MPKVNSTAIERVRPAGLNEVRVDFHGGKSYIIEGKGLYRKLRHARSVGAVYNREVRGRYPTERIR